MMYLILIVGMLFLVKGADFFVDGSASVAKILKVPSLIIGLTIVALGTSLPEASVSITASIAGNNELALSNVVGSNIFNTLVVVGCSAMIAPFVMHRDIVKRDLIINLIVSVALCAFMFDGVLSRLDGILLLIGLVAFMLILIRSALRYRVEEEMVEALPIGKSIILIIIGVAAIILGGNFVVSGASDIARQWGMSDTLIGLTIVSIGTSLPELVTSVVAARKGESSLSLGNAIGSNILNILFILGISGTLTPIAVIPENIIDVAVLIGVALFVLILARFNDKMTRMKAAVFIGLYAIYMAYIIAR
ncbi:MAG: calcium/sodium antiporter [Negativibacillus sp.]|nr:calcium/sodium antiporter [Negativibacillus sp.]